MSKARNSGIEMLRILAMLLIIAGHDVMASGLQLSVGSEGLPLAEKINLFFTRTLFSAGHWGAITFFLITGYFWRGEAMRWRPIGHILLVTAFYLLMFPVLAFLVPGLLPALPSYDPLQILIYPYWFITAYLLMMALYPLLVRQAGERLLSCLTWGLGAALLLLWGLGLTGKGWVVLPPVYLLLAPLFFLLWGRKLRQWGILPSSLGAGLAGAVLVFLVMAIANAVGEVEAYHKTGLLIAPLNILLPTCLLLSFLKMPAFHSPWINKFASLCLGIYLIHGNPYINLLLWGDIFLKPELLGAPWLLPRLLGEALLIFTACGMIEYIRQWCAIRVEGLVDKSSDHR